MRNFIWRWRILIAVFATSLLLFSVVRQLVPQVKTATVVIAKQQIAAGQLIGKQDLEIREIPRAALSASHFSQFSQVVGRRSALAIPKNTLLIAAMLVGKDQLGAQAKGKTVVSMTLRPADWQLVFPGAQVLFYLPANAGQTTATSSPGKANSTPDANPPNETSPPNPVFGVHATVLSVNDTPAGITGNDQRSVLVAVENRDADRLISSNPAEPLQLAVIY